MPKTNEIPLLMTIELVCSTGSVIVEKMSAPAARAAFVTFVNDCSGRNSKIREINLYDNANRLWKTYKQLF